MGVSAPYVGEVLRDLVRIDSVNPDLVAGAAGERAIGAHTAERLEALGLDVTTYAADPARPSVVGCLPGGSGPSVMLYAHCDTVGVEGMNEPFSGAVRGGRLYGRGAYDMKGGLAACLGAVHALRNAGATPAGDVVVAAVADEEVASLGMQEVLAHVRTDAAIVTEPTDLTLCLAHKGFCWITVETHGRAAHGSRPDLGVDANLRMGRFLARLEALEQALRARPPHPLVGPPSLHAGVLRGGTGPSTYAARASVQVERRTIPGETSDAVLQEITALVREIQAADPGFEAHVRLDLARDAFEVAPDAAIVRAVRAAAGEVLGAPVVESGQTPWMDAALLAGAGIETVVIGPAGAGAHADEEWVDLNSVARLAGILAAAVRRYQAGPGRGERSSPAP